MYVKEDGIGLGRGGGVEVGSFGHPRGFGCTACICRHTDETTRKIDKNLGGHWADTVGHYSPAKSIPATATRWRGWALPPEG